VEFRLGVTEVCVVSMLVFFYIKELCRPTCNLIANVYDIYRVPQNDSVVKPIPVEVSNQG
jgi:hypothetical protein